MPDAVNMTFVTTDVTGGTWLEWGDSIQNVTDMVDQALARLQPGQCIGRLIICSHGAMGCDGFVAFDSDTTGGEVIDGGMRDPIVASVREQLARLRGRFCADGFIEFRVCRFGAGVNGAKALQAVSDVTGVNVTGPVDSIKGVMGLGGIATSWATARPGAGVTESFWRGDGSQAPRPPTGGGPHGGDITEIPRYIPMPGIPPPAPPGPEVVPPGAIPQPGPRRAPLLIGAAAGAALLAGVAFVGTQGGAAPSAPPPTAAQQTAAPATVTTPAPTAVTTPAPAPYGGSLAMGYDHPPFAQPWNVGGNSVFLFCGTTTGVPPGSAIAVNVVPGVTGAPASVSGPVGADGSFLIPAPITSFGTVSASVREIRSPSSAVLAGSIPAPTPLVVAGGPDVACRR